MNRRGGEFTQYDRDRDIYFMAQRPEVYRLPLAKQYSIKGLSLAVIIDYKTCNATALVFDEKKYDVYKETTKLPKPVHQCEFKCDLTGMKHIKVANTLENLFFEVYGIDSLSGIRSA